MFKYLKMLAVVLCLLTISLLPVHAQEALVPDKPIEGEITDAEFAQEYRFQGEANQVVVLELTPKDVSGDLDNPALILQDETGEELVRYDAFGQTTLIWELPKSAIYTVIATRRDDTEGLSVGEYTLTLRLPALLNPGETLEMDIAREDVHYYVIRSQDDFALNVTREGDFAPEFSVNEIDTEATPGTLDAVAVIGGKYATQGLVGVIPGRTTYVIRVGRSVFSFQFGDVTASYTLNIKRAQ
jgi:hypothetical protein